MKINNTPQGAVAKTSFPKLRLTAKFAFASLLFLSLDAAASANASKLIFEPTNYRTSVQAFSKSTADTRITGTVVDETGQPLVGVSVKVKGDTKAVSTDANGSFTISAPENAVLVFSYIGYNPQEVPVSGKSKITVKLLPNSADLHEVVVTALGIVKDSRKVGYAVTTVKGDALNTVKETNVALSLEGQVAGLSINGTNGGPGSSARILLRGVTSFGASSPLFVINGVPMDNTQRGSASEWGGADYGDGISNINPDDIESMTVLKGQSASALYGSRAANGVILITTKGGKKNSGLGVEYSTNYQIDKAVDNTNFQDTYGQGQYGLKPVSAVDALNAGSLAWGAKLDGSSVIQFDGKSYAYSKSDDNYLKFYDTGHTFTNTLSLDGGGETGTFRLSASTLSNASIVPNSGLSRKTFNFSGTQDITKQLTAVVNVNYIDEFAKNKASLSDGPGNPNNVVYLAPNEGQSILNPGVLSTGKEQTFTNDTYATNPYWAANQFITNVGRKRLISSISLKYQLTDWIYAQARIGYDNSNNTILQVEPTGTAYLSTNGNMTQKTGQITELNSDVLVGVKHDIVKDYLNFDISGGGNIRTNTTDQYTVSGNNGFVIPYFYSLTNFGSRNSKYEYTQKQTNSAYYTADFNFKDYLTLSTTGRYDVYSTLPENNNSIFSPSVSASLIYSNLIKIPALDYGKLRMSYAQTSGEPANIYGTNVYYNVANSTNGLSSGTFSQALPNLFLKPFTLKEFEVGTEMKFLKGRLGLDVDYFARKTQHEIISSSIDISSGYSSQYIATGSTQNRGVEIEINGTPIRTNDFSWSPSFNFTYVKNKILATDATGSDQTLGTYRPLNANLALVVGMPGPQIMAYDYLRDASGNIVYANGLPQRSALKAMGSTVPKIYGGFTNNFTYKKFSLSVLADYRFGNKILSGTNYNSIFRGENQITLNRPANGVIIAPGVNADGTPNTTAVKTEDYYQGLARNISALNVLDGSFIKLRQASFGYTFGKDQLGRTPFSSITFNLVARNIWTIMKHSDNIDPESTFSSDIRYAGIEGTSLPSTRTYGFSLKINLKK